jgi:assimilatory nitrate reductase catalytic subunit
MGHSFAVQLTPSSSLLADTVQTHCPYCALQCGMTLSQQDGAWQVGARDFPTNKGGLCRKGWTAASLLGAPDRLTTPLLRDRRGLKLRPASWDEALDRIAGGIAALQARHGCDSIGVFGGGGLTNEKAYLLGKFARVALRSANIDYNGRFCMAAGASANLRAFGLDRGLPFPLEDIPGAEVILLPGGNPAETMPPIMQYFEAQKARGGKLIVADPRRTPTAKAADLHLALSPGTDAALANGLLHIAIRDKLIDTVFIGTRTRGFEAARRVCNAYWPDRVERITGVPAPQIERAAHMLGEAATAMVLTARGAEQQSHGTDNVLAYINLLLALGRAGRKHSGYGCITGQGNGQGGREHGQKADQLPGYRKLTDDAARAHVGGVWGVDPKTLPQPGLSACDMFKQFGTGVRGLLVFASNILVSSPDAEVLSGGLGSLDLLVVADMFLSETASRADVVLPVAQWAEEDGTMTNLEGRVIRRRKAMAPPDGVWTDQQVLAALADRLGCKAVFDTAPEAAFAELGRASSGGPADYAGISYARIDAEDGVFWPCADVQAPGTPRLFLDRFATEDGRARFHAIEYRGSAEQPDRDFPYTLTTGRLLAQYQTGAQTRRVPELAEAEPAPFAAMHPDLARSLGVAEGDDVRLTTRRGSIILPARLTRDIRIDTIFAPFHWGGRNSANLLTIAALDPVARIPEFKACAVHVGRLVPPKTAGRPISAGQTKGPTEAIATSEVS